eukprot:753314-Hanusia_phi.AAC.4
MGKGGGSRGEKEGAETLIYQVVASPILRRTAFSTSPSSPRLSCCRTETASRRCPWASRSSRLIQARIELLVSLADGLPADGSKHLEKHILLLQQVWESPARSCL